MATRSGDKIGSRRTGRRGDPQGAAPDEPGSGAPATPATPATDTTTAAAPPIAAAEAQAVDPWVEWAAGRTAAPRPEWAKPSWADRVDGGEHLQPFTRTAEVPVVAGGAWATQDVYCAPTGMVAALPRYARPRAPFGLRLAVWLVALVLLAAVAGLVVHQVRPQWLRSLEVGNGPAQPAPAAPSASSTGGGATSGHAAAPASGHPSPVRQTQAGPNSAAVSVTGASFQVIVSTQAPCWVQVTSPASFAPVFSQVMPAGTTQTFASSAGQLTVQVGASKVLLQVRIGGKTVPGWQFTPSAVPFTLNFTSVNG